MLPSSNTASNTAGLDQLVPDVRVRINGRDLPPEAAADLHSVVIESDVETPSMFMLRLINWNMDRLEVTWSDDELFAEGNEVTVLMGYVDHLEPLLVGEITGLEPEFRADEVPMLTVRGYDRRHRLMRGRRSRTFTEMKDSDIAAALAGDADLKAEVEDSVLLHPHVRQDNQTDLDFLQARARRIGFELFVQDRSLVFRPRPNTEEETLRLSRFADLLEFHPRLTTMGQTNRVVVRAWSAKDKGVMTGEATAGNEGTRMGGDATGPEAVANAFADSASLLVDEHVASQAEADALARGRLREMALSYITGDGTVAGRTDLQAGTVVRIEECGRRFSGLYYVTSTRHSFSPQRGYRTTFRVRRNAS